MLVEILALAASFCRPLTFISALEFLLSSSCKCCLRISMSERVPE